MGIFHTHKISHFLNDWVVIASNRTVDQNDDRLQWSLYFVQINYMEIIVTPRSETPQISDFSLLNDVRCFCLLQNNLITSEIRLYPDYLRLTKYVKISPTKMMWSLFSPLLVQKQRVPIFAISCNHFVNILMLSFLKIIRKLSLCIIN